MFSILSMLWMTPYVLLYVVGILLSLINWSRSSTAALLTLLGCSLKLTVLIGGFTVSAFLYHAGDGEVSSAVNEAIPWVRTIVDLTAMGMIIMAAFIPRATDSLPDHNHHEFRPGKAGDW